MSRELEVVVSNIASFDVDGICEYLASHSAKAAERFATQFGKCLDKLAVTPFVGSRPRPNDPTLRFTMIGKYVVYYRVENDRVWIQRVLHSARDADRLL